MQNAVFQCEPIGKVMQWNIKTREFSFIVYLFETRILNLYAFLDESKLGNTSIVVAIFEISQDNRFPSLLYANSENDAMSERKKTSNFRSDKSPWQHAAHPSSTYKPLKYSHLNDSVPALWRPCSFVIQFVLPRSVPLLVLQDLCLLVQCLSQQFRDYEHCLCWELYNMQLILGCFYLQQDWCH